MVNYSLNQFQKRMRAVEGLLGDAEKLKEEVQTLNVRDHIAEAYYQLHEDISLGKYEFINLPGGRGSGKSSFCALELISQIMKDETRKVNALVIRKYAVSLRGSVFSQIQWALDALGVSSHWKSTLNPMEFRYETGQVIRLSGLDDPQKLKSIKPARGYFKLLWLEEFSEITGEPELRNLQQSVLRGGNSFLVFRSFNPPISKANWCNQFVQRTDNRSVTLLTDYTQIPVEWLGQSFIDEAERLKEINPRAYEHEYLGLAVGSGSEVFETLEVRKITEEELSNIDMIYCGLDWGFSSDPACVIRCSYNARTETVMVIDELYQTHLSNRELAEIIKSKDWDKSGAVEHLSLYGAIRHERQLIIADSAEPKSIADMKSLGLKCVPCTKFAGCVLYRIKWLQHRKIIVDPDRTPNTARELQNYCYEVDRHTGDVLSSVPDKDNHSIDALAYSLDKVIYRGKYSA